jgi:hypothetical protein
MLTNCRMNAVSKDLHRAVVFAVVDIFFVENTKPFHYRPFPCQIRLLDKAFWLWHIKGHKFKIAPKEVPPTALSWLYERLVIRPDILNYPLAFKKVLQKNYLLVKAHIWIGSGVMPGRLHHFAVRLARRATPNKIELPKMFLKVFMRIPNNYGIFWKIPSVNGSDARVKFDRRNLNVFPVFPITAQASV